MNSNPCMKTVIHVIDHMMAKFGNTYAPDEMPKWMYEIHTSYTTTDKHNVQLFILKIILNRSTIFKVLISSDLEYLYIINRVYPIE